MAAAQQWHHFAPASSITEGVRGLRSVVFSEWPRVLRPPPPGRARHTRSQGKGPRDINSNGRNGRNPRDLRVLSRLGGRAWWLTAESWPPRRKSDSVARSMTPTSPPTRSVPVWRRGGLTPADLDWVGFYDKPLLKFRASARNLSRLRPARDFARSGWRCPSGSAPSCSSRRRWHASLAATRVASSSPNTTNRTQPARFFPSPFEEAAILTVDGVGEWTTASLGVGRGHRISLTQQLRFPHSLGLLYSALTYYVGFRVNSGEHKVMGLAPTANPSTPT